MWKSRCVHVECVGGNKKMSTQPPDMERCSGTRIRRQRILWHSAPGLRENLRFVTVDDLKILKWRVQNISFFFYQGLLKLSLFISCNAIGVILKQCMFSQWGRRRTMCVCFLLCVVCCLDPSGGLKYTLEHEEHWTMPLIYCSESSCASLDGNLMGGIIETYCEYGRSELTASCIVWQNFPYLFWSIKKKLWTF